MVQNTGEVIKKELERNKKKSLYVFDQAAH